ncbi:MAG: amidohydrolase family protein [Acidimicrobiia bacterium]
MTTMAPSARTKVSADTHVNEPHDLWYTRLDRGLRDKAPRRIQTNDDGTWRLVIDGGPMGWGDMPDTEAKRLEREREAAADPAVRIEAMRVDGINAEVIYPTIGLYLWNITDGDVGTACCRIYNDWIDETMGGQARIGLTGTIPTWNVDAAVAEVERNAERGFVAHMMPIHADPTWNHPQWERLWAAINATGKPVVMHQATGHEQLFYRGWGSGLTNLVAINTMAPRVTVLLASSGVLARYPDLHVILVEVNGGWLGSTIEYVSEYQVSHAKWQKPALDLLPSEYIKRQMHVTFQNDPLAVRNRDITGVECLLWGNDYPHAEGTYPNSAKIVDELFRDVPDQDVAAMIGGTAAKLFGFSDELLATPV